MAKALQYQARFEPVFQPVAGVTFDAAAESAYSIGASSYSWTHVVDTRINRVLIVCVSVSTVSGSVSSVTYNSVGLTNIPGATQQTGNDRSEIWYLIAPATGSNTVLVTLSTTLTSSATSLSYYNADQTAPIEATGTNTGNSTTAPVTVTTLTTGAVVLGNLWCTTTSGITSNSGQNSRGFNQGATGTQASDDKGPIASPGTTTVQWNNTGSTLWVTSGISIKPPTTPFTAWGNMTVFEYWLEPTTRLVSF